MLKQTKSHKRDKCVKILLIIAENCIVLHDSGQPAHLCIKKLFFSVSLLFRLLKSPPLSHNLNKYPQKNLSFSLALFHIHIPFHDPAYVTSVCLFCCNKEQRTMCLFICGLQVVCCHGLSWIQRCFCLSSVSA